MILSRKLLQTFIPSIYQVSKEKLVDHLIAIGLEVEQQINVSQIDYLTIGKILEINQHTYSKDDVVCTIQIKPNDSKKTINIICKKNKIDESMLHKCVVVALEGSEIRGKVIVKQDISGIVSEGIICTYNELSESQYGSNVFNENKDEIVVLDYATVGDTKIDKYLGIDDYLIDITIPHNRSELHGVKYIAIELAASLGLKCITKEKINVNKINKTKSSDRKAVEFINLIGNKTIFIGGVAVVCNNLISSPWLLKGILLNHNIQPTNVIEDMCKLTTILTGVPLFLCDLEKISGNIFVKTAEAKQTIIGTDNNVYKIAKGDIILTDNTNKIISLAGICVNKSVGVDRDSKKFLALIGSYDQLTILETSERIGNFSNLFVKGINPVCCTDASIELRKLLNIFSNDSCYFTNYLVGHFVSKRFGTKLQIDYELISNYLGLKVSRNKIKKILSKLGFMIKSQFVSPPAYRTDINCWQDIAEEVLKNIGIGTIPQTQIEGVTILNSDAFKYDRINKIIKILTSLQMTNVSTTNLCSQQEAERFNFFNYDGPLKMECQSLNSYLRLSLTNSLLEVLQINNNMKIQLKPIFEIQKIYSQRHGFYHLGIVLPTAIFPIQWKRNEQLSNDIFLAKGIVEKIINLFGFECTFKKTENEWMINNNALQVYVYNNLIGYVGLISKKWLSEFDLDIPVYCIELNIEQMLNSLNTNFNAKNYKINNNLQSIIRDMTIQISDENNPDFDSVRSIINSISEIKSWDLISIFHENNSSAYTIRYELNQDFLYERTSNDINLIIKNIFLKLINHGFKIK